MHLKADLEVGILNISAKKLEVKAKKEKELNTAKMAAFKELMKLSSKDSTSLHFAPPQIQISTPSASKSEASPLLSTKESQFDSTAVVMIKENATIIASDPQETITNNCEESKTISNSDKAEINEERVNEVVNKENQSNHGDKISDNASSVQSEGDAKKEMPAACANLQNIKRISTLNSLIKAENINLTPSNEKEEKRRVNRSTINELPKDVQDREVSFNQLEKSLQPDDSKNLGLIVVPFSDSIKEKFNKKLEQLKKKREEREETKKKKKEENSSKIKESKSPNPRKSQMRIKEAKKERKVSVPNKENKKNEEEVKNAITSLIRKSNTPVFTKVNNRKLIYNALTMVLLIGEPNKKIRDQVMIRLNDYRGKNNLVILFKNSPVRHDFKGLYEYTPSCEDLKLYFSSKLMPPVITSEMVETYYRYDSANKEFKPIQGNKSFTITVDAISLKVAHSKQWKLI